MGKAEKSKTFLPKCVEKIVSSWQKRKRKPLIWIDKKLKANHLLNVVERLGHLAIIVAVVFYFWETDERRMQSANLRMQVENLGQQLANQQKARHYQAWQVINAAQGKPGSGGRMDALQDLNKDGILLSGVDVSQAYLPQVDLENAYLPKANLSKANLFAATLSKAILSESNLSGADFRESNLSGADFRESNLSGANLSYSKLFGAQLVSADLSGADLSGADLSNANLYRADLSGADLCNSNLSNIKNWRDIKSIECASIYGVNNPPQGFVEWAKGHGALIIQSENEYRDTLGKKIKEKKQQEAENRKGDEEEAR